MQIIAYPSRKLLLSGLYFLFLTGVFHACTKVSDPGQPPEIQFVTDSGYTSRDTSLVIGGKITIGLNARGENSNITYFRVTVDNGVRLTYLDSGLNHSVLKYTLPLIKSVATYEKWTFFVMDRERNRDSVTLTVHRADSASYGKIRTMEYVTLDAQSVPSGQSLFSFSEVKRYTLDSAFLNQQAIDLIYYYGQYNATLSSPNESDAPAVFTGPYGLANWTIKNETRYDTTQISVTNFDKAMNDSLLLAAYEPAAGKRKAKFIEPGMILSFKNAAGKIGLIKITAVIPGTTGGMEGSVKIQE
jgi:hypothetical protein